ncbi:hypothetical protein D9M71_772080 [compost metagenome]
MYRDRVTNQGALLLFGFSRVPTIDLHGPRQPRQKVGRTALRVSHTTDDLRVNAQVASRGQGPLQVGRIQWQQTHESTSEDSVTPLQLG